MAYVYTWNAAFEADPADSDDASGGATDIRQTKAAIRERMAKDHYMDIAGTDADHGEHKWATLREQATKPDAAGTADKIYLYSKESAGGETTLFLEDENANEIRVMGFVGELRQILGSTIPTGWLALKGDTLGDGASGADEADDKYEDLFTLLWDELTDSEFPINTGRGASAAADWAADKYGTLPDARGRILIGAGQNTFRKLDFTAGGTHELVVGDTIEGETGGATAVIDEIIILTGTWAGGDAAGYFIIKEQTGTFEAEELKDNGNTGCATIAANSVAMSDRTLGDTGGTETKDTEHTHAAGAHIHDLASYAHGTRASAGSGFPVMTDGASLFTATAGSGTAVRDYTDAGSGNVADGGSTTQDVINPWLAATTIIKY